MYYKLGDSRCIYCSTRQGLSPPLTIQLFDRHPLITQIRPQQTDLTVVLGDECAAVVEDVPGGAVGCAVPGNDGHGIILPLPEDGVVPLVIKPGSGQYLFAAKICLPDFIRC